MSVLVITDVTGLDEGVYKCSVSNRFGQAAISAHLTVQGIDIHTVSLSHIIAGRALHVYCVLITSTVLI